MIFSSPTGRGSSSWHNEGKDPPTSSISARHQPDFVHCTAQWGKILLNGTFTFLSVSEASLRFYRLLMWLMCFAIHETLKGWMNNSLAAPYLEFGGSEKGRSLISAYWSTTNTPGFKKLSTALDHDKKSTFPEESLGFDKKTRLTRKLFSRLLFSSFW